MARGRWHCRQGLGRWGVEEVEEERSRVKGARLPSTVRASRRRPLQGEFFGLEELVHFVQGAGPIFAEETA
jgi:hypothetical protein